MRKLKTRLFTGLLAVMLCCTALTPAAFAYAEDPEEGTSEKPVTGGVEPEPLTPEGNLTIVDDIEGDAAGDKQFITVQTKSGNTFYIIVDRAADGENTVYFLNAVDEADLMALMEDGEPAACSCMEKCAAGAVNTACPVCAVNMTECAGKEAEPEPTPEPEETPEPEKGVGGLNPAVLLAVLVLLAAVGRWPTSSWSRANRPAPGAAPIWMIMTTARARRTPMRSRTSRRRRTRNCEMLH